MELDHTRGVFSNMVAAIYRSIVAGELPVGARLPTELQLRERYAISINSVRRGISVLEKEGIVVKRQGSGMYVARVPIVAAAKTRQDAVGVYFETRLVAFHPYFSELRRGITDELARKGWEWLPLAPYDAKPDPWENKKLDITYPGYRDAGIANLATHPEVAGVILSGFQLDDFLKGSGRSIPAVVPALHQTLPFAGYDWTEEMLLAMRLLIRRGARGILSVGGPLGASEQAALFKRAVRMETVPKPAPVLVYREGRANSVFSIVVQTGYEQTRLGLRDHPDCDAVLAGDDFIAQGALDALTQHGASGRRRVHMVALINRNSRIHSAMPYTAIVADGYRVGTSAVELLHEKITAPLTAPDHIILRGDVREIRATPR